MNYREPRTDSNYAHLVLLAENQKGYQNLVKLVSMGFIDGFTINRGLITMCFLNTAKD